MTFLRNLNNLVKNGRHYYVRIKSNVGLISSCEACSLVSSDLRDQFIVGINKNYSIVSLDYIPQTYACGSKKLAGVSEFKTIVSVLSPSTGVMPTKEEVQKPKAVQEEGSFFLKILDLYCSCRYYHCDTNCCWSFW